MKKFVRVLCFALVAVMLCASLVACGGPAKDPADAKAALDENGYTTTKDDTITPGILSALGYKCDSVVTGTKTVEDDEGNKSIEHVSIYYFTNEENAEKALNKVKEYAGEKKNDEETNWVDATLSGSMIYFGTEQAIKDAK